MRIFLAAPLTNLYDPTTGFNRDYREIFERILRMLKDAGHDVHSAHLIENWGKALRQSADLVVENFNSVRDSDLIVAFLCTPISQGVLIELGWGSAFQKPIVVILDPLLEYSPMVLGLADVTKVRKVFFELKDGPDQLVKILKKALIA